MEVGKLILNVVKNKASMTLSVKPFGCMPSSSVSDGVQSLITEKFPGTIYCAVETSGDGAVNFQSRVQMYLFKARKVAEQELTDTLARHHLTIDQVRDFIKNNPRFGRALHRAPFSAGSTPVELVNEIGEHINHTTAERFVRGAKKSARNAAEWTKAFVLGAPTNAQRTMELGKEFAEELADIAKDHGPTLMKKGVEQAKTRVAKLPLAAQVTSLFDRGASDSSFERAS
jgi:hypothetical protein